MPRMTKRTPEMEAQILQALSDGTTLVDACGTAGIHYTTWREWCRADESLDIAHARAREDGFLVIAERTRETARGRGDSTADVQRDKLIIDTDLKLLAKWDPKRYGDKLALGGADDLPPMQTVTKFKLADLE